VAGKVVAALFQLGMKARIAELPADEFAERVRRGACDLYIGQLAVPVPRAELALVAALSAGGDPGGARALRDTPLADKRLGATLSKRFAARLPIVPLYHRAVRVHHRSDLRGIRFDLASRLHHAELFFFGRARRSR
jgi:hypothetical protein